MAGSDAEGCFKIVIGVPVFLFVLFVFVIPCAGIELFGDGGGFIVALISIGLFSMLVVGVMKFFLGD